MAQKSLILYQSMTGNTEKVAFKFKEVFLKKGWECTTYKIDRYTSVDDIPEIEPHDFICVGSPVIESLPPKAIHRAMFDNRDTGMYRGKNMTDRLKLIRAKFRNPDAPVVPNKRGLVFVTYSGAPPEAQPSLHILEHLLTYMRVNSVGQFACRGSEPRHWSVNYLADQWYGGDTDLAAESIALFASNPDHPSFAKLSSAERETLAAAVPDNIPGTVPANLPPFQREIRPSERDMLKAQIFMEEILEERNPDTGPFICIA